LLASVLGLVAAQAVLAAATVAASSPGTFVVGGPSSPASTYTITETGTNGWSDQGVPGGGFTLDILINEPNVFYDLSHTPVVSGPGTLGTLSAAFVNNQDLRITATTSDPGQQEAFTVSGIFVKANVGAALGPVDTRYVYLANPGNPAIFGGNTVTAHGTLATSVNTATNTVCIDLGVGPNDVFVNPTVARPILIGGANPETITNGVVSAVGGGGCTLNEQRLTKVGNFAFNHAANDPVTEQKLAGGPFVFPSLGNVVNGGLLSASITGVLPNVNNQPFGTTTVCEPNVASGSGTFAAGAVVTITIDTPNVVFSANPTANTTNQGGAGAKVALTNPASTLNFARTSATWTISTADAGTRRSCININGTYDVGAVPAGTPITVTVTVGATPISPAHVQNAVVGTTFLVNVKDVPDALIGSNFQPTGTVTITEPGVGTLGSAAFGNVVRFCLEVPASGGQIRFSGRAWVTVVNPGPGTGTTDLTIRNPSTLLGATTVEATPDNTLGTNRCFNFSIFHSSTTGVATIAIVGEDPANPGHPASATGNDNGPRINVPANAVPQQVVIDLAEGTATVFNTFRFVVVANAVFPAGITVTALDNLPLQKGGISQPGGNVRIQESAALQLNADTLIQIMVLPNAKTLFQEEYFAGGSGGVRTTDFKITSNTGSGLVAHVQFATNTSIGLCIDQPAFSALGDITVSGFRYTTVADATEGNVLLEVSAIPNAGCSTVIGPVGPNRPRSLDTFVSNAHVVGITVPPVSAGAIQAFGAAGVNKSVCSGDQPGCAFTSKTVIVSSGNPGSHAYCSVRFSNANLKGVKGVDIWMQVAAPDGTFAPPAFPGAFHFLTTRDFDANGYLFYPADALVLSHNATFKASFIAVFHGTDKWLATRSDNQICSWT